MLEAIGTSTGQAFFIETGLAAVVARSPGREIGIGGHRQRRDDRPRPRCSRRASPPTRPWFNRRAGPCPSSAADLQQAMTHQRHPAHAAAALRPSVFTVQASRTALTNGHALDRGTARALGPDVRTTAFPATT